MLDEARLLEIEKRHKGARRGPYRTWTNKQIIDPNGQVVAASVLVDEDRLMLANAWKDVGDLLEEVRSLKEASKVLGATRELKKVAKVTP